jgi:outer membrane receptor protein involved in Fe transport
MRDTTSGTSGQGYRIGVGLGLTAVALIQGGPVHAAPPTFPFALAAGSLQQALVGYAALTGRQLLYPASLVAGRTTSGLTGSFTAEAGLSRLLAGTGLAPRTIRPGVTVLVIAATGSDPRPAASALSITDSAAPSPQDPPPANASAITAPPPETLPDATRDIVVTGTHIRGGNPGAPPVTTITRADMTRDGYATVAQALQALPGNFGGMATEQSALASSDTSGNNDTLATGVNLRGLGASATLVLVNGERMGGSGFDGDLSDVSSLPSVAVDRVEVLLDGASAIYGSDAVGGVVNILLRKPRDGAETTARFGSVTDGRKRDLQLGQSVGRTWSTGGILLAYEYDRSGRLASADRTYASSADSRPFGGTDHRYYFSLPGNILGVDPVTGNFGPLYAIRPGPKGTALTPQDFLAGVTNLENSRLNTDLIPQQVRHSAYGVLTQDVGDHVHLSLDGRYSHRAFDARQSGAIAIDAITPANPYFVSPTGASSDLFAYSLGEELGPTRTKGVAEALATSLRLDADLGRGWQLRSYAGFAQARERSTTDHLENDYAMQEALGTIPDDPATPFSTATDGFFNPYGDGHSNSQAILDFVGSGFARIRTLSRVLSGHVDADGSLFDLPGGAVKLAVGGDIRRETFHMTGVDLLFTPTPQLESDVRGHRLSEAAFAELHVPIVGVANALPGVRSLDLSVAGRVEHYDDFGTTTNPKIGLSWTPVAGLTMRTSYGTSFRAPNLSELNASQAISTTAVTQADGSVVPVIQLSGGNIGLRPETAHSWTAGFDFAPKAIPGLSIEATWFRTIFSRRIGTPALDNFSNVLVDPALAPFVTIVAPATNAADLARVSALLDSSQFSGGNSFPASSIGAIVDTRYVNTGRVDVSGIDLTVRYTLPAGRNRFDVTVNGSYLGHYREEATPTSASVEMRNLAGEPVALRGRATLGWTRGPWSTQLAINQVGGYHDLLHNFVHAWSTVDLGLDVTPKGAGWAKGIEIALTAQNLFDQAPPFYDSRTGAGYDASNADALGRYVSLQLTKHW